jgi:NTE family protein
LGTDHNPLRALLESQVDFERLRRAPGPELHIAATRADSGRLRLFSRTELCADVLLASACLPMLQPAVIIDGHAYWDGGYSANPAVFPLVHSTQVTDILMVVLSPWRHMEVPVTASQVHQRAGEIGFTAAFLREMQALADERDRSRKRVWLRGDGARVAALNWHLIDGHEALAPLSAESRLIAHRPFLEHLRDAGRERTLAWLDRHATALGRRSSIDLQHWFGGSPPGLLANCA